MLGNRFLSIPLFDSRDASATGETKFPGRAHVDYDSKSPGKTFSVPLDAMSSQFPPIFFPFFCYSASFLLSFFRSSSFFLLSLLLSLSLSLSLASFFVLFCFRCRREEKRVTRGCFAQRLDAVARFFARKIMAALWIYADEIV